jgi:serine/threonine protein phosphatase 1
LPGRTIAIGDIHGWSAALKALLTAIDPRPEDEIITLGDYIDRGPDSKGVLEQLIALAGRCKLVPLTGNHEVMFFDALDGQAGFHFWMEFGGGDMLASYGARDELARIPEEHVEFLRSCLPYYETNDHIFVHANYWPNRAMRDQSTNTLFWEVLKPELAAPHYSQRPVIVGHTPQPGHYILDLGFLKCIDTGCGFGGRLTAIDVYSGRVWQATEHGEIPDD